MRYLPKSDSERREMLDAIGAARIEDLFAHLPAEVHFDKPLNIAPGASEYEIVDYFRARGAANDTTYRFLGAGVYSHYRPVVVDTIVSRGEFLTSYTPYQAEISQGTLTAIFEFQTMLCQLTGMDVANASMYDGSSAVPEAGMMAMRITGRDKVLVARSLHPEYRQVLDTYARHQGMKVEEIGYDKETGQVDLAALDGAIDASTAAVIVQSPNFFGIVEQTKRAAEIAHAAGALLVFVFTEAVSLGLLEPPGSPDGNGADIVAGELQSFAIAPSYGGPYAGVIACQEKYVRQLPGRLVGETKDASGQRAYCLTLATREQHIRREKATSNICTNQALIALMATVFMALYGKVGLRELAEQNLAKAHYLGGKLKRRFSGPYFNEFVAVGAMDAGLALDRFYPELTGTTLLCCTEMVKRSEMDALVEKLA